MKRDHLPKVAAWLALGVFVGSLASCSSTHSNSVSGGEAGAPGSDGSGGTSGANTSGGGAAGQSTDSGATGGGGSSGTGGSSTGGSGGSSGDEISGDACVLTTDCDPIDDSYICLFQICSPACAGDRDCDTGQRCLLTEDGAACVEAEVAGCRDDGDCPAGSICLDDDCRTDCSDDATLCLNDQECSRFGVCQGTDAEHDAPPDTPSGTPCDSEGEVDCAGVASIARLVCENGYWVTFDACEDGQLCVPTGDDRGSCQEIPADCIGRDPNESFCDGTTRKTCSVSLLELETEDCPSIQHCTLGQGSSCAVCLPNTFECDDDILKTCNDDGTGTTDTDCALEGAPCSATAGACTEDACSDDQLRCEGDVLERCNDQRDGFDSVGDCGAGLCDSQALECDVCISGTSSCVDGQKVECSADGQTESVSDCDSAAPYCIGAGNCVECTQASHCPAVGECATRTCDNNNCSPIPVSINTPCSGGVCDGAGNCVECTSPSQCGDTDCTNPTCVDNTCGSENEPPETDCSAGVCNSSGICVGCVSPDHCSVSGECYNPTCSGGGSCGQTPKGSGQTCSDGYCNGSGACVECTSPSHCSASGECYDPTCSGGGCGQTPKDSGDTCSGGYCNGNGSCVECTLDSHCDGGTPVCFNGSCVECSPSAADICASSCTRQVRSCSSAGTWQNDTLCTGTDYCLSGSCVDDTITVGWDEASGSTTTLSNVAAQKFEISCESAIQYLGAHFASPGSGIAVMAIYRHDSANNRPGDIYVWTTAGNVATDGSWTREPTVPQATLDPGTYWVAVQASSNAPAMRYTSPGDGGQKAQGTFDLAMPSTWSTIDTYTGSYHMYLVVRPAP